MYVRAEVSIPGRVSPRKIKSVETYFGISNIYTFMSLFSEAWSMRALNATEVLNRATGLYLVEFEISHYFRTLVFYEIVERHWRTPGHCFALDLIWDRGS